MEINVKEVSLHEIQKKAEDYFRGGYFCCEALMRSIKEGFALDVPEEVIAMSSGMAVGVGRSGCMCGAVNGGVMALGMMFGRTEQNGPQDPKVVKCMSLTHELHDWFKEKNGKNAICCRVLTKEFDMAKGEHKEQCIHYTGLCAWKVGEIISREYQIPVTDAEVVPA